MKRYIWTLQWYSALNIKRLRTICDLFQETLNEKSDDLVKQLSAVTDEKERLSNVEIQLKYKQAELEVTISFETPLQVLTISFNKKNHDYYYWNGDFLVIQGTINSLSDKLRETEREIHAQQIQTKQLETEISEKEVKKFINYAAWPRVTTPFRSDFLLFFWFYHKYLYSGKNRRGQWNNKAVWNSRERTHQR